MASHKGLLAQSIIMHIEVTIKEVYGKKLIYPHCDRAKVFTTMLGTKTLTLQQVKHINALGFEVRTVNTQPATI